MLFPMSRDEWGATVGREERSRGDVRRVAAGGLATRGERLEKDWSWERRVTPTVLLPTAPIADSSELKNNRGESDQS